jgi:tRNA 5-methylaminomethyl-2-thiouridine biosynthesis bifunctional protein
LRHPGIRFVGNAPVASLHWADDAWTLRDGAGHVVACAEVLVIANATGCRPLLLPASSNPSTTKLPLAGSVVEKLQILQAVHGTISRGPLPRNTAAGVDWPVHPVNGHGSFIPAVPGPQGLEWLAGATFEPDTIGARSEHTIAPLAEQHRANLHRLEALLPAVGQALAPAFQAQTLSHWSGTRCVTHDRLPLVGPLLDQAQPSLWIQAGQGARGLSFSALGAELLVAQLGQEPWPLDATLARSLDVRRVRRRKAVIAQDGD